jgi:hypothetical protein
MPYIKVSGKPEFHENQLTDSHTLLKGINEFIPVLSMFLE